MNFSSKMMGMAALAVLSGCASLAPDGGADSAMSAARPAAKSLGLDQAEIVQSTKFQFETEQQKTLEQLLTAQSLSMESALKIALLNNPSLAASMAQLRISDAERVQAAMLPNPHFSFRKAIEGNKVFLERSLGLNLLGLLTIPWRSRWQNQQHEIAKLQAAQEIVRTLADTRKAWIRAVAAQQSAQYAAQSREAAEAAGQLARRMARVGNWSKLNQAREQALLADAAMLQAKAENTAFSEREKLIRYLGLWGQQTQFKLPDRLPDLPKTVLDSKELEKQALAQRLDVRSASERSQFVAQSLGYTRVTGFLNALDYKAIRETAADTHTGDREKLRGWELELPIPIFDWGGAANAKAQGMYWQSVAQLRTTAVNARSEVREAWHSMKTAHDVAAHYRDEIVPLRKFINDEALLRYNGMLIGVFELFAEARTNIAAVNSSIEALRNYWLIDTDLQLALTGTSPGAIAGMSSSAATASEAKGH